MGVKRNLHGKLLGGDTAMFDGISFVDELDRKNGSLSVKRYCLLYSVRVLEKNGMKTSMRGGEKCD